MFNIKLSKVGWTLVRQKGNELPPTKDLHSFPIIIHRHGIPNKNNIKLIKKRSKVPVIVDAGIGCASDASIAMELGCDGVLVNSAIAKASKPILMAEAMKFAVIAGRKSYLAGRMKKREFASASSPKKNLI